MSAKLTSQQKRAIKRAAMPQNIGRKAVVNGRVGILNVAAASRVKN